MGSTPPEGAFNAVMASATRAGQGDAAFDVLAMMKESGVPPTEIRCVMMMMIMIMIKESGVPPTEIRCVARGLARGGGSHGA
jgi:pentatricopeptide repeat protein